MTLTATAAKLTGLSSRKVITEDAAAPARRPPTA
jgi:hypothetical protein